MPPQFPPALGYSTNAYESTFSLDFEAPKNITLHDAETLSAIGSPYMDYSKTSITNTDYRDTPVISSYNSFPSHDKDKVLQHEVIQEPTQLLSGLKLALAIISLDILIFISALDTTIVATVYVPIGNTMNALDKSEWIITSYLITVTAFQPLYGKISDILGRVETIVVAIVIFLIGSILCAVSKSMDMLIISRAIQGIGGAGLMSLALIVIADIMNERQRGKYVGVFSGTYGVASAIAPIIGGSIVQNTKWQVVFWINIPFCVIALPWFPSTYCSINLFKVRNVFFASAASLFFGFAINGTIMFIPQWALIVKHASEVTAGAYLIPCCVGMVITSVFSGIMVNRTGRCREIIIIGAGTLVIGNSLLIILGSDGKLGKIIGFLLISGLGIGTCIQTISLLGQASVDGKDMASTTTTFMFFRSLGMVLAVSVLSNVIQNVLHKDVVKFMTKFPQYAELVGKIMKDQSLLYSEGVPSLLQEAIVLSYAKALKDGFITLAVFTGIFFVLTFGFKHIELKTVLKRTIDA
ncbi:major facilitator superfamily domain-containing protein [Kickxella alabastrina]|uniref:major facilitator superfamily domain-containing protein n=1 Tax=Kickxella alabastrina TaxID=61397 RepID=UPI00221F9EAD|nr:major facilitator superfamily domain-containing protein [Kickxella alabastrina]KAI7827774.1 major facilitator superfamily domain-containing protein [Kickxella alabastrina]